MSLTSVVALPRSYSCLYARPLPDVRGVLEDFDAIFRVIAAGQGIQNGDGGINGHSFGSFMKQFSPRWRGTSDRRSSCRAAPVAGLPASGACGSAPAPEGA